MEYKVYVKLDDSGYITTVNSSAFLTDITGWVEIDSGYDDKYHHAQGNYFPMSIITEGGAYRYKLADGKAAECTAEEIEQQEKEFMPKPNTDTTLEGRVDILESDSAEMKEALELILAGVTE